MMSLQAFGSMLPLPLCLIRRADSILEYANPAWLYFMRSGPNLVGRNANEIWPHLLQDGLNSGHETDSTEPWFSEGEVRIDRMIRRLQIGMRKLSFFGANDYLCVQVMDVLSETAAPDVSHNELKFLRILAVEDSKDNQDLISIFLSKTGASVEFANTGEEALERAMKGNFDVILMDLGLPGISGCETTRKLRELGFDRPIVALTGHAMQTDFVKTEAAGCNAHLCKPFKQSQLIQLLKNLCTVESGSGSGSGSKSDPDELFW